MPFWRKKNDAGKAGLPGASSVRLVDPVLNRQFDDFIASRQRKSGRSPNTYIHSKDGAMQIYLRIGVHTLPYKGKPVIAWALDIANILMPDESTHGQGRFPAFLDHVEKVILGGDSPVLIISHQSPDGSKVPLAGVFVESIQNPKLLAYLTKPSRGYEMAPNPFSFGNSPSVFKPHPKWSPSASDDSE